MYIVENNCSSFPEQVRRNLFECIDVLTLPFYSTSSSSSTDTSPSPSPPSSLPATLTNDLSSVKYMRAEVRSARHSFLALSGTYHDAPVSRTPQENLCKRSALCWVCDKLGSS